MTSGPNSRPARSTADASACAWPCRCEAPDHDAQTPAMTRLKVLIVDDEDLARLRMRSLLADCAAPAAEVSGEAASSAEALHWLAGNSADLVLLDINMPGLDGLQLAERLRALPVPPKIVFVTAHAHHAL